MKHLLGGLALLFSVVVTAEPINGPYPLDGMPTQKGSWWARCAALYKVSGDFMERIGELSPNAAQQYRDTGNAAMMAGVMELSLNDMLEDPERFRKMGQGRFVTITEQQKAHYGHLTAYAEMNGIEAFATILSADMEHCSDMNDMLVALTDGARMLKN